MHPIHAQLLGVTPLKLKANYAKEQASDAPQVDALPSQLVLSPQLLQDILLAIHQDELTCVQGESIALLGNQLQLPNVPLNAQQKKQLWRVLCDASSE
ncbi:hypothetical protein L1286_03895 [Pseudoalteromonas sp. SMS1]|uniref:hypothetical protein n=1 Tax=Pseudoalteromonas sp. SMS1 TaxID=2908894 RepID=UPI001F1F47A8|nr:hypothetical protein [Pseudoalteromonas sp. SMS1]MCF2856598.1 hypothetical protein [Pseudoalteromonas sp. SMS1]